MNTQAKLTVPFGYNVGIPEGVRAAWGARLIITQQGDVDFLYDRQGASGDDQPGRGRIIDKLQAGAGKAFQAEAAKLLRTHAMLTRESQEFTLVLDGDFIIKGNTLASAGYLYVCAYFQPKQEAA